MCKESNTSFSFASTICASKNESNAFLLITVASIISPSKSAIFSFRILTSPYSEICLIETLVAADTVMDFSL